MCKVEKLTEPQIRNGAKPIYYEVLENGCHLCKSHRQDRDGYFRVDRGGKEWQMHRYVYTIHYGEIPAGMEVCHKCDHPYCINKDHYILGTHAENMQHKKLRNRFYKKPQVLGIKDTRYIIDHPKMTITELARELNVSHSTIIKAKRKLGIKKKLKRVANKESISKSGQRNYSSTKNQKSLSNWGLVLFKVN